MSPRLDVIVVGLGGTGSAAAHRLAERGARVLGLEQRLSPHGRGPEDSRIIRHAYPDDPAYVPMLVRAHELWRRLERCSGHDLLRVNGGLIAGADGGRLVGETVRAAQQWGVPFEVLGAADIARRFPAFRASGEELAVYDPWAGFVRSRAAVAAQLRQARRSGARLRFGEKVLGWESRAEGGVGVSTEAGTYLADRLVLCPGAWASHMLSDLGIDFRVERRVQSWFRPDGDPGGFRAEDHPICIWEDRWGQQVCALPGEGGAGDAQAAFSLRGLPCTPDGFDEAVHDSEIGELGDRVSRRLPSLTGRFRRAATCMDLPTVDKHFVVANHPRHEGVTVACGLSERGFGFVPVLGEAVADLVLDGSTIHPIELFAPERESAKGPPLAGASTARIGNRPPPVPPSP